MCGLSEPPPPPVFNVVSADPLRSPFALCTCDEGKQDQTEERRDRKNERGKSEKGGKLRTESLIELLLGGCCLHLDLYRECGRTET